MANKTTTNTQLALPALPTGGSEALQVLQMVEAGRLNTAQALELLQALKAPQRALVPFAPPLAPSLPGWRSWWRWPVAAGSLALATGTLLAVGAFVAGGLVVWFLGAGLLFGLGLLAAGLGLAGRNVRWLHVRVSAADQSNQWPRTIAFSLPLPLRTAALALRALEPHVPQLAEWRADELILALAESTSHDNPFYVAVDEGEGGQQVFVCIG